MAFEVKKKNGQPADWGETDALTTDELNRIENNIKNIFNFVYPIGAIYMSASPTNPSTLFGGNWVAWGAGRVPVGMGTNGETNYTIPEQTGGREDSVATHTHTLNQTSSGSGTTISSGSGTSGGTSLTTQNHTSAGSIETAANLGNKSGVFNSSALTHTSSRSTTTGTNGLTLKFDLTHGHDISSHTHSTPSHTHTTPDHIHTITAANNGTDKGNRMPFITCYMWKRTA